MMECDVLVVGGGPAGLVAAFFLSPMKDVCVIERLSGKRYDGYHSICGEGISDDAFRDIRPIQPWGAKNHIDSTRLVWPDGTVIEVGMKGYIIDRPVFLTELKDRCDRKGVRFVNGMVSDIEVDDHYIVKLTDGSEIRCRYLIGADGAFSVVRKKVFHSSPKEIHAVKHYITNRKTDNSFTVFLDERYKGSYRWLFPSGESATEGFAAGYDSVESPIAERARFIPYGGVGDIVNGNAFLLGDAAAMANPVSFGGLKAAMLSGKKAASAILKGDPKAYARWWKRSILSSKRFMDFHHTLGRWTNQDMTEAVKPFRNGHIVVSAIWALLTRPWNINMYIGCLFAFKFSW